MSEQTTLIGFNIDVQPAADGGSILILTEVAPPSGNAFAVPLPAEVATEIGRKLVAPRVQTAGPADLRAISA